MEIKFTGFAGKGTFVVFNRALLTFEFACGIILPINRNEYVWIGYRCSLEISKMFEFAFTLDDNDYYEFNIFHMYYAPMSIAKVKRNRIMWPCIFILMGCVLTYVAYDPVYVYRYGGLSIGWSIFFKPINNFFMRMKIQGMKKFGKLSYNQQWITLRFLDDQIIEESRDSGERTGYSQVEHVFQGECAVYIYKSAMSAYIVPNRVFENDDEKNRFIAYVESKIVKLD